MKNEERNQIEQILQQKEFKKNYWNGAMSFDIETSSFYYKGEKAACMYLWAFAIEDYAITGRTWDEFKELIDFLQEKTDEKHKFIIYVHNLSYEFQWMQYLFEWKHVFAISKREVVRATTGNITFKCSLLLSGLSLASTAKKYNKKHTKLTEIADYKSIRTPESVLTENDYKYVKEDVLCVTEYIDLQIKLNKFISEIPLTSTGAVRKELRSRLYPDKKRNNDYARLIDYLTLEEDEYLQLKKAYAGGFTHANWHYAGRVIEDVTSMDFTSSYPAVMLLDYMPVSKGMKVPFKYEYLDKYCCVFTIHVKGLREKVYHEHFLSFNKCTVDIEKFCKNQLEMRIDNGRVMECEELEVTMTELDFDIFKKCYDYDEISFSDCWIYKRGFLPKKFMEYILELYRLKTELKGVKGQEIYYNLYKAFLNSLYGMLVTDDIGRPLVIYKNEWKVYKNVNLEKNTKRYNNSKNRFSFYPWGVFVTAHARHNLWTGILECGDDYKYSDTDSLKITNFKKHEDYFRKYNENIEKKIKKVCEFYHFDESLFKPKTQKGEEKMIGVWDYDGHYKKFKTLGAKRYLVEKDDGTMECTIAGLPKKAVKNFGDNPFEFFEDEMYLDEESSMKNCVTYCDHEIRGKIKDKNGKICRFSEKSFVHIEGTTFELGLAGLYKQLLSEQFKIGGVF